MKKGIILITLMLFGAGLFAQNEKLDYTYRADTTQSITYTVTTQGLDSLVTKTFYSVDGEEIRVRQLLTPAEFDSLAQELYGEAQAKMDNLTEWDTEMQALRDTYVENYKFWRKIRNFWGLYYTP